MRRWPQTWLRCSGSTCTSFDIRSTSREHSLSLWGRAGRWWWSTRPRTRTSRSSMEWNNQAWFDRQEALRTQVLIVYLYLSQRHLGDHFGNIRFCNSSSILVDCRGLLSTRPHYLHTRDLFRMNVKSDGKKLGWPHFPLINDSEFCMSGCACWKTLSVTVKQTLAAGCQITAYRCIHGWNRQSCSQTPRKPPTGQVGSAYLVTLVL